MNKHGWSDPAYARNTKTDPLGDQQNSSIYTRQNNNN